MLGRAHVSYVTHYHLLSIQCHDSSKVEAKYSSVLSILHLQARLFPLQSSFEGVYRNVPTLRTRGSLDSHQSYSFLLCNLLL
jgi:hypothetical protein